MNYEQLFEQIVKKQSFLCVGLDTDINKIPKHLLNEEDPLFAFNKEIIDATANLTVAYKPNLAFYEEQGWKGLLSLEKTVSYIRKIDSNIFIIADAKRGDIGNTSSMYAKAFFETMDFDAITVAPYMGEDSVKPFLDYGSKEKWTVILALTSNKGAYDLQMIEDKDSGRKNHEQVLIKAKDSWGATPENSMFVVGATKAEYLTNIRKIVPHHFLLIPGVGAQGGSLEEVVEYGMTSKCGLLVNNSRAIIYADNSTLFAGSARKEAYKMQQEMAVLLNKKRVIV